MTASNDKASIGVPAMHEIVIDGVRQVYHIAGEGPVCLVHAGGPGFQWSYMRMPLLEKSMTVVYLEAVGTGNSDNLPGGEYTMPKYAYFAHQVAAHIGAHRPLFLGHSHGGFVGLQYALDYPNELGGLILYSSAPCMNQELGMEQVQQLEIFAQRWADRPEAQDAKQAWMDMITGKARDREAILNVLGRLMPAFFGHFWRLPDAFGEWRAGLDFSVDPNRKPHTWDVRDDLETIELPTLILAGEYDFNCGPRWAKEMDEKIPGSQLVIFEQGGHMNHVETPQAFAEAVNDFVARISR
ncbi:alpha/beta fold hydrolase [Paenibacillus sacheonensis]|uniref:Alpha/beta fold hydrolase n=1 Tax=Paenibacillus sacheonensis TaxID=742054 RepID=A0A7X5C363_9BACL|nr:alpha/beta hydrolase [Paenibacillus sacheonensis]MBM7567679.1 proline iminopeptidase [Paenibacillus sacheonensis]NBC72045.1 alpha/beta fold hydrolase [Paenibacillus sacheonensis]